MFGLEGFGFRVEASGFGVWSLGLRALDVASPLPGAEACMKLPKWGPEFRHLHLEQIISSYDCRTESCVTLWA